MLIAERRINFLSGDINKVPTLLFPTFVLHLRSTFLSNLLVYFISSSTVLVRPRRELSGSYRKGCIKVLGRFSFVIEM